MLQQSLSARETGGGAWLTISLNFVKQPWIVALCLGIQMLDRLKSIFRSDAFVPTMAVFPSIDSERLAKDLRLQELGQSRGKENQPPSETKDFDHVETGIIERIEELRRKGLENFESNRSVYNERLARASYATKEVDIVAGTAKGDFGKLVQGWKSAIEDVRDQLNASFAWRKRFREKHRLERPAKDFEGWTKVFAVALILIAIEAAINAYLFSQGNEFGLLGGWLAAVIVSFVNVGLSALLGYMARYIHCRNWLLKLGGLAFILGWMAFAVAINLAVAHFRDGLESGTAWRLAAESAVPKLLAQPLYLASIESWLLVGLGVFISTIAFRKGWHTDDAYPGYGRVERQLKVARANYVAKLGAALDDLTDHRDEAISNLQDANEQVRQGIAEAVDTLFGQSTLGAHLQSFLDQCDVKTAHLLAVYRDANRASRSTPAPKSFDKAWKFPAFKPQAIEIARKDAAEAETANVAATVQAGVKDIFDQFEIARKEFEVTRTVQADGSDAAGGL